VDILTAIDSSRSFIYHAATLVSQQPLIADAESACRMAKAQATETLKFAGTGPCSSMAAWALPGSATRSCSCAGRSGRSSSSGMRQHHRQRLAVLLLDH
jgi:acyl-CoA dehydrogenase